MTFPLQISNLKLTVCLNYKGKTSAKIQSFKAYKGSESSTITDIHASGQLYPTNLTAMCGVTHGEPPMVAMFFIGSLRQHNPSAQCQQNLTLTAIILKNRHQRYLHKVNTTTQKINCNLAPKRKSFSLEKPWLPKSFPGSLHSVATSQQSREEVWHLPHNRGCWYPSV